MTENLVMALPVILASTPCKRCGRNSSRIDFSTGVNSSLVPCLGSCVNFHSWCRYFCNPAYAACGFRCANPSKFLTPDAHLHAFSPIQVYCAMGAPMYPPRYCLLVEICTPHPWKKFWSRVIFLSNITNFNFVVSSYYPLGVPRNISFSRCACMCSKYP